MQKIVPSLWFDQEALEAARFYTSLFEHSQLNWVTVIKDTPSGDSEQLSFTLEGLEFFAISAGPIFTLNPSVSFSVYCQTIEEVDRLWEALREDGTVLMELGTYPFNERFGWLNDKYGLSWQLMYVTEPTEQKIYPSLLFVGDQYRKVDEALAFYADVFANTAVGEVYRYGTNEGGEDPEAVMFSSIRLEGTSFLLSESSLEHNFSFNESISFIVYCEDQAEIDYYWEKMSAVPEAEQCGWLKDQFGVSWQITPREMDEMMKSDDEAAKARAVASFLPMKKLDIQAIRDAYEEK